MNQSTRTLRRALFACVCIFSLTSGLRAQTNSNSSGLIMWPGNPPVGIGTQATSPFTPSNALHIHFNPPGNALWPAIIRLSEGASDTGIYYGALALMPDTSSAFYTIWSNLAAEYDLVLHEHDGDLILANFDQWGGAIRLSTTPSSTTIPIGTPHNDLERMTIDQNGNVGINIPPNPGTPSLCAPLDQIQIGGGLQPPLGSGFPTPGLTISGGNRFENLTLPSGKIAPNDRRYIGFNYYIDHTDTGASRFHRFQPMASSHIEFSQDNNGLLSFQTEPYDAARGLNSFSRNLTLELSAYGLGYWVYDSTATVQKHTLFEINPPGIKLGAVTRNTNGLAFFHTPVCITSDTASYMSIDFQNLPVRPNIGDDTTRDLVVNGAALFKEAWVNSSDWPDYVLQPDYHLMTIDEFGNFMAANHHLPEIPPAEKMQTIPIGKTESDLTKQVEELSLYIVQLNKEVEALKTEVQGLKNGKEK